MRGTGGFFRRRVGSRRARAIHGLRSFVSFRGLIPLLIFFLAAGRTVWGGEPDSSLFGKTVRSINYSADLPLDRTHYDSRLGIQPGDPLTRTALKTAIQSLYDSRRFDRITVDALPEGDGVTVLFALHYSYYFNKFSLEGNVDLEGKALWEWVALPTGQRFTDESLEKSRLSVERFMRDRGFYEAKVQVRTSRDEENRQVNAVFEVESGKLAVIRSIGIEGVPPGEHEALLDAFRYRKGKPYDRSRLADRLESLRKRFTDEGYLAAAAEVAESYDPDGNSIGLTLKVSNFGKVRVVVKGYKIDKNQLRRLLPVLTGEGVQEEILNEGANNLKEYLENRGYSEADVSVYDVQDNDGTRELLYVIEPGRKYTVEYVRFDGNTVFSDRELLASVGIQPSSFLKSSAYSATRLDGDVEALKALYESRGYMGAGIIPIIEPLEDGSRLGILYKCAEGPRSLTRSVQFGGNVYFSNAELEARIGLKPGGSYSPSLAERDRQVLLAAYSDAGYLQARVVVRTDAADEANAYSVEFQIEEGTRFFVDRILVLGDGHTRQSLIDRRVKLKTGDPLSLGKLLETQQSLYRLGVFDQVRVTEQNPESTTPYQNIVVRLQESRRFTMRYGIGYQEHEKLRGTLEFSDLNILGLARRADLRLRGSNIEQQAVFNLRQTQFRPLPVDSYFTLSASYRQSNFDIRRLGASYQFSQPLSDHSWGLLRYNFQNVRSLNLDVTDPEYDREDTPRNLSTFSVVYVNDSRDNYLDPTVGFFSSTDFGVTTRLLGDNDYISFFTQNSYYRKLPKSFMTAFSIRFGLMHPYGGSNVPVSEHFFAGGGSSLRGFDTDFAGPLVEKDTGTDALKEYTPVGGNALFIGSIELRRPILSFFQLAGFYDTGNVFSSWSDVSFADFSHTLGAGLRIKTPFGPLRIDYGYNMNLSAEQRRQGLTRGHLFITIGPPF